MKSCTSRLGTRVRLGSAAAVSGETGSVGKGNLDRCATMAERSYVKPSIAITGSRIISCEPCRDSVRF